MAVAMKTGGRIESLLSARLFLNPQLAGDKLYFISDLAGRLSLYRMDVGGSVPEPLLPPGIALQNPELLGGYVVLRPAGARPHRRDARPGRRRELPAPRRSRSTAAFPSRSNEDVFGGMRIAPRRRRRGDGDRVLRSPSRDEEAKIIGMRIDLATGEAETLGEGMHGPYPVAWTRDHSRARARRRLHGRRHRPLRA